MKPYFDPVAASTPPSVSPLLEIKGLGKVFHLSDHALTVLDNIHLAVQPGELICILGRSGCGKTTLLNILAGFISASSGEVLLNARPIIRPGPDRCVVFQEAALFPWMTVRENIALGLKIRGCRRRRIRREVDRYLSLVGLRAFANYLPREISGGMKQRVALARVLILNPQVLLMDEPFTALDAQTREEMRRLLLSLWQTFKHTILFVTHDVREAVALADRIILMNRSAKQRLKEIHVTLARPRAQDSKPFIALCRHLFDALGD